LPPTEGGRLIPEPIYEALWPSGRLTVPPAGLAERLPDLRGRTIGLVWDYVFKGDEMFELIKPELEKRYPGIRFVDYSEFGNVHGPEEQEVVERLPGRLAARAVDAVIVGVGA
jgi:hypothetical protein